MKKKFGSMLARYKLKFTQEICCKNRKNKKEKHTKYSKDLQNICETIIPPTIYLITN